MGKKEKGGEADTGTILRFIEVSGGKACLLGARPVEASFDNCSQASYFDHIVSNVHDRNVMCETLKDVLDFEPKVDFNAGVVAAGEAQIESTVIGNNSDIRSDDLKTILEDQSQIYIPINNALSPFGHVHLFIEELGQGVQHIAHRVPDLVQFIARANGIRKATGAGMTFKGLPRSYFGTLTLDHLTQAGLDLRQSKKLWDAMVSAELLSSVGIFHDLDSSEADIEAKIIAMIKKTDSVGFPNTTCFMPHSKKVAEVVSRSRYVNIHTLLKDKLDTETYMLIVRNGILVDIQDADILFQIFSKDILQRNPDDEAPFIETIQRVCAQKPGEQIKPGCGGFGIRNFLALFLSIEMNKAFQIQHEGAIAKDQKKENYGKRMVQAYTDQMNESNPILTAIAEGMTAEGKCKDALANAKSRGERSKLLAEKEKWGAFKEEQNKLLKDSQPNGIRP